VDSQHHSNHSHGSGQTPSTGEGTDPLPPHLAVQLHWVARASVHSTATAAAAAAAGAHEPRLVAATSTAGITLWS